LKVRHLNLVNGTTQRALELAVFECGTGVVVNAPAGSGFRSHHGVEHVRKRIPLGEVNANNNILEERQASQYPHVGFPRIFWGHRTDVCGYERSGRHSSVWNAFLVTSADDATEWLCGIQALVNGCVPPANKDCSCCTESRGRCLQVQRAILTRRDGIAASHSVLNPGLDIFGHILLPVMSPLQQQGNSCRTSTGCRDEYFGGCVECTAASQQCENFLPRQRGS